MKQHNDETVNIARENAVGTLNYMSPEAIVGAQANAGSSFKVGYVGRVVLGCILYQMAYGHTPFSHIKGQIQKPSRSRTRSTSSTSRRRRTRSSSR